MPLGTEDTEIEKWQQDQFTTNIQLLPQYMGKLQGLMDGDTYKGRSAEVVKQLGATEAEFDDTRNGDTPIMSTPRYQRWVAPRKWHWGDLFDPFDLALQLVDPTSKLTQNAAIAMGRKLDTGIIIPAFFGNAKTGEDGTDSTAFPADGSQDVSADVGGADTGMSVAKLIRLRRLAMENEIDITYDPLSIALTGQQAEDLWNDAKYVDKDYADNGKLENGVLKAYMGVNIVHVERIQKSGNYRWCPAWCRSGMHVGKWSQLVTKIGERHDKQFNTQVYLKQYAGATRTDEKKVFKVICKEA